MGGRGAGGCRVGRLAAGRGVTRCRAWMGAEIVDWTGLGGGGGDCVWWAGMGGCYHNRCSRKLSFGLVEVKDDGNESDTG